MDACRPHPDETTLAHKHSLFLSAHTQIKTGSEGEQHDAISGGHVQEQQAGRQKEEQAGCVSVILRVMNAADCSLCLECTD